MTSTTTTSSCSNTKTTTTTTLLLQSTLHDLQIRSAVQDVMDDLLIDVELSHTLYRELHHVTQHHALEQNLAHTTTALDEARLVRQQREQSTSMLADTLVQELVVLSQELGHLSRVQAQHDTLLLTHDETVAKLWQAQERIRILEGSALSSSSMKQTLVVNNASSIEDNADATTLKSTTSSFEPNRQETGSLAVVNEQEEMSLDKSVPVEPGPATTSKESLEAPTTTPPTESEKEVTAPDFTGERTTTRSEEPAVVVLIPDDNETAPATLDTIDMAALTHIFGFLDALEILSTAQINISMYSRVDALFGFSEGAPDETTESFTAEEETTSATESKEPAAQPVPTVSSSAGAAAVTEKPITTVQAPAPTAMTTNSSKNRAVSPTETTPKNSKPAAATPRPVGGIFSLLQARGGRAPRVHKPSASTTAGTSSSQLLSASMADSMAAKLTDTELGAIITMKENLHKREKDVTELTKEKEELAGRLEGTEALKEFLVQKVQEVEKSLSKRQEDDSKTTQQIASDQEVIAFLDSRVHELERDIKTLTEERKGVVEERARVKLQNTKKITVLSDMLQFERERVSENEREWKATKKLLVKEIKSCRAQLVALQAERDGFREQNEKLKRAIVSTSASNGSMRD